MNRADGEGGIDGHGSRRGDGVSEVGFVLVRIGHAAQPVAADRPGAIAVVVPFHWGERDGLGDDRADPAAVE